MERPSLVEMALRNLNREYRGGSRYWMPKEDARDILRGVVCGEFSSAEEWRMALLDAGFKIGDAGTPAAFLRARDPKYFVARATDADADESQG